MKASRWLALGAGNMFLAVATGAFGAHALKATLSADMLAIWHTAAQYQMIHALGLLAIGGLLQTLQTRIANHKHNPLLNIAAIAMLAGIVLFCGSLYALALSGIRLLGAITPFGGLAFLLAWALLAAAAWKMLD
jgi:uncharacterized membrane protein YgdD (TMEM256/DUF423 family)